MNTAPPLTPPTTTLPPIAEMERAYLHRDPYYNGLFFIGVRTTAIFCRPTCPARSPLPKNVEYFPTAPEIRVHPRIVRRPNPPRQDNGARH